MGVETFIRLSQYYFPSFGNWVISVLNGEITPFVNVLRGVSAADPAAFQALPLYLSHPFLLFWRDIVNLLKVEMGLVEEHRLLMFSLMICALILAFPLLLRRTARHRLWRFFRGGRIYHPFVHPQERLYQQVQQFYDRFGVDIFVLHDIWTDPALLYLFFTIWFSGGIILASLQSFFIEGGYNLACLLTGAYCFMDGVSFVPHRHSSWGWFGGIWMCILLNRLIIRALRAQSSPATWRVIQTIVRSYALFSVFNFCFLNLAVPFPYQITDASFERSADFIRADREWALRYPLPTMTWNLQQFPDTLIPTYPFPESSILRAPSPDLSFAYPALDGAAESEARFWIAALEEHMPSQQTVGTIFFYSPWRREFIGFSTLYGAASLALASNFLEQLLADPSFSSFQSLRQTIPPDFQPLQALLGQTVGQQPGGGVSECQQIEHMRCDGPCNNQNPQARDVRPHGWSTRDYIVGALFGLGGIVFVVLSFPARVAVPV